MRPYEHPPVEVERVLRRAEIDYRRDGREGAFVADLCPACRREASKEGGLHMSWIGEGFVFHCVDFGCTHEAVEEALGLDPLPRPERTYDPPSEGRRVVLTDLSRVRPRPVRWLWRQRIPLGVPSLLAGKPKLGKSTLAYDLAAKVTTGALDGDLRGEPANVLVVTFEDLVAETVVPRLMAAGADLERVRTIEVEDDGERDLVSLPDDVPEIGAAAVAHEARLLIVDPLMAALAGGTDAHRDNQVRRVLAPLAKLAEERDLAVLTVMHLNKGQGADLIGRIGGSVAFTGAARSLLVFGADPQDPDGEDGQARALAQRGNLAMRAPSLAYRVEGRVIDGPDGPIETSRLVCLGESETRADELLAAVSTSEERSATDEAVDFLRSELAEGARSAKDLQTEARGAGITDKTLRTARERLGIRPSKSGFDGGWIWALHEDALPPRAPSQETDEGHLRANPHEERDSGASEGTEYAQDAQSQLSGTFDADAEHERVQRKLRKWDG